MNSARSLKLLRAHLFALFISAFFPPTIYSEMEWEFLNGRWSQNGEIVRQTDAAFSGIALAKETRRAYSASAKVRFKSSAKGAAAGLVLQAADSKNCFLFVLEQKKAGLYAVLKTQRDTKKSGYSSEEAVGDQAPVEVNPAVWQELRAEVEGPHIAGYLNGKQVVSFSFLGKPPQWYAHGPVWPTDLESGRSGLHTKHTQAEFSGFRVGPRSSEPVYTPYRQQIDSRRRIVPRQSFSKTFTDWTRWFADSVRYTEYGDTPAEVHSWPPYLLSSFVYSDDSLGSDIQYPGHNHPPIIEGYVRQYLFGGDKKYLDRARQLADWNLQHSTPAAWAVPYLALSHFDFRKHLRSLESIAESGFEPDKSAYQGLAYLLLYGVTEDKRYLEAAIRIGETLRKLQRDDGGFPFRVRPKDGRVVAPYTASLVWYVRFFEDLAGFTGNKVYREVRDHAFHWLMQNPVKTNNWQGFYGDIATGAESYDQWTALDAAMYLLERRHEDKSFAQTALNLVKWVEGKLVVADGFHPGVPAILEQTSYPVILTIHTNRLAEVYARLWGALGDQRYKELAEQIGNSITWLLMSDGKMRAGLWYHAWGTATSGIIFNGQFMQIMAEIPETAPRDENHFLHHNRYVRDVAYLPDRIVLQAWAAGEARLSLRAVPRSISDDSGPLSRVKQMTDTDAGWSYDPNHHLLRIRHRGKKVEIRLAGG